MKDGTHCSPLRLGISGFAALFASRTKRRITDGWRWKFQSRFAILISCSFLFRRAVFFLSFFPLHFWPVETPSAENARWKHSDLMSVVGLVGVNPRVNFRPTWETVARWKLFRINDLELEGTTQRIFPGSAGTQQHRITAQHLRATDTQLEVTHGYSAQFRECSESE